MEKKNARSLKRIVVTGPESSGKTSLCQALSEKYNTVYIPEYARDYIKGINRRYNYDDIEHIALKQVLLEKEYGSKATRYLFYDTHLIITKVWFLWCYDKYPDWIDKHLETVTIDLFLLCGTDLEWEEDDVRENGGENRERLFALYKEEINKIKAPYKIITGKGNQRSENAVRAINNFFNFIIN